MKADKKQALQPKPQRPKPAIFKVALRSPISQIAEQGNVSDDLFQKILNQASLDTNINQIFASSNVNACILQPLNEKRIILAESLVANQISKKVRFLILNMEQSVKIREKHGVMDVFQVSQEYASQGRQFDLDEQVVQYLNSQKLPQGG